MAGRGKSMTLPAWMTAASTPAADNNNSSSSGYGGGYGSGNATGGYGSSGGYGSGSGYGSSSTGYGSGSGNSTGYGSSRGYGENSHEDKFGSDSRSKPGYGGEDRRSKERDRKEDRHSSRDDRDKEKRRSRDRDRDRRSRSKEKRKRSRSRDDKKDDRREDKRDSKRDDSKREDRKEEPPRSKSDPDAGANKWALKRAQRQSQFDQKPPNGIPLPPQQGLGSNLNPALNSEGKLTHGMKDLGPNMAQTRHARRLYVGGVPEGTREEDLGAYFNNIIRKALPHEDFEGGEPVLLTYINQDKCFAFLELISIELTTSCCQLDGLQYKGNVLKIRRPNDYRPELLTDAMKLSYTSMDVTALGLADDTDMGDSPNKIYIGGLPLNLTEENVEELLLPFGDIKSFTLVREPGSTLSKGYAYCEYVDPRNSKIACDGLNNLPIGDKVITVKMAGGGSAASLPAAGQPLNPVMNAALNSLKSQSSSTAASIAAKIPSKILLLDNMVTAEELQDDSEYNDICDDVREECSQYGTVKKVVIPRQKDGYPGSTEGSIYVEFETSQMAKAAAVALVGRKFAERTLNVDYYDEIKFSNGILV